MTKFSFFNSLKTIYSILSDKPSIFLFIIIGVILLVLSIVGIKKQKKINRWLFILGWVYFTLFIILNFFPSLLKMSDNFINEVFYQIFFPNFSTYIIILIITNIFFLIPFLSKKASKTFQIINTIWYFIIMVLALLSLEVINENNINIYERLNVFSNSKLLVLIQTSTIFFVFWIILDLIILIIKYLIGKSDEQIKEEKIDDKQEEEEIEVLEI